jgi:hypothetical protein
MGCSEKSFFIIFSSCWDVSMVLFLIFFYVIIICLLCLFLFAFVSVVDFLAVSVA